MLHVGDAAADFSLKDSQGIDRRLSAYSGQTIALTFFKRDNNRLDNMRMLRLRDVHDRLGQQGAIVVGVSLGSVTAHAAWRTKHGIPFHLLSDQEGRVHDLYDAWRTTLLGRRPAAVQRCTYLIDDDGIIRKTYAGPNVLTHAARLVKDVERLRAQHSWGKKDARPRDLMP
jgi:peroxiredoxin Q/BCP